MSEPLRNHCSLKGGTGFPEVLQGMQEGEFAFIKVSDMSLPCNEKYITVANNYVNKGTAIRLGASVFPARSIVFAKVGAALLLNRRRMLTAPTIIDNNMMAAIPTEADPDFLFHFLCSIDFANYVQTGALPSINQTALGAIPFPKFSLQQQRSIATILSTMDNTIEKTEALIAKYQQIKAGLMHDLFTRGVTTDGKLRPSRVQAPELYQETPIGWIPKEWDAPRIGDIFDIQLGKMLNKLAKTGKGVAPYLGNRAVQWDFIDSSAIEEMDFSSSEREKFSLVLGDLLVCEGGDVGRTAMWRGELEDCYFQKAIHRLRPKSDRAFPAFMLRFMRFAKESGYFREFTSQSSIAHLTQEKLSAIPMLLPKPDEQRWIAERFDAIDRLAQNEQSNLYKLNQQKLGLMFDLLTGKVRAMV